MYYNLKLDAIANFFCRYKEKVKEIADTLSDESSTSLERVVWWTEYVIRHKGAPYFRSPAVDMPWYQYYLLDVIGLLVAVLFLVLYIIAQVLKYAIVKIFCGNNTRKNKTKTS